MEGLHLHRGRLPLCVVGLAFFCAAQVSASVILKTGNFTYDPLTDMPADFGPRVPNEGLQGLLLVAEPEDACEPLTLPPVGAPWIALVTRSQEKLKNCTFDVKVRNVEAAGAIAAIIYDDIYEPLIIMSKPYDHPDPGIPAVFVSQKSGVMLKRLMTPGITIVEITPISDAIWLSMLMSAFAGFLAMSVVMGTFFFIRQQRLGLNQQTGYNLMRPAPRTMSPEQIRALPVVVYEEHAAHQQHGEVVGEAHEGGSSSGDAHAGVEEAGSSSSDEDGSHTGRKGGGTRHTCAICLENYSEGDKLRVLPCQHRYHTECIDQWLSSRKPLCPACRHDATERDVEAGQEPAATEPQSMARRAWAFLGGSRWLLWRRRRRHQVAPAARHGRRLVINVPAGEEQQGLIQAGAGEAETPNTPQLQQQRQLLGVATRLRMPGQGGAHGSTPTLSVVVEAGPAGLSVGSRVSRSSSQGESEPEITPEVENGAEPPSRRSSPRSLPPAALSATSPVLRTEGCTVVARHPQPLQALWAVESQADSSTEDSDAEG